MNEPFSDELISAYLDGELTAEEQSLVEQALVENAECRQLFEELRALRGSLQSLPSHRPPSGFSQRVIRRAERAMLQDSENAPDAAINGKPAASEKGASHEAAAQAHAPTIAIPAESGAWRGAAWIFAAAALAAALLVAINLPDIEISPVVLRPTQVIPNSDYFQPHAQDEAERDMKGKFAELAKAAKQAEKAAKDPLRQLSKDSDEAKPRPAGALEEKVAEAALRRSPGLVRAEDSRLAGDQPSPPAAEDGKNLTAGSGDVPSPPPPENRLVENEAAVKGGTFRALADGLAKDAEGLDLRVVRIDVTREALESGAFDALLRRQNIRFDDETEGETLERAKGLDEVQRRTRKAAGPVAASGVDVVYVEAAPAQLERVLADLQKQPARFLGLVSQPLAAEEAEPSLKFNVPDQTKLTLERDRRANLLAAGAQPIRNGSAQLEGAPAPAPGAPGGAGGFGGGAPARTFAPAAPVAGPAQATPAGKPAVALAESKAKDPLKADVAGRLDETREVGAEKEAFESFGRASRIASPSFNQFARYKSLKLQSATDALHKAKTEEVQDRIQDVRLQTPQPSEPSETQSEAAAKKTEAPKKPAEGKALSDSKPGDKSLRAERESAADDLGEARGAKGPVEKRPLKESAYSSQERASQERASQERVRVLFVIRAVEQE